MRDPRLLVCLMGGSRMAYRAWKEHRLSSVLHPDSKPVLVAGAGSAADFFLRALARSPSGVHGGGPLEDLVSGRVSVSSLRRIELDDLLGRDPVQLDDSGLHQLLTGQVVMVTGAGGSIGSELGRPMSLFEPAQP